MDKDTAPGLVRRVVVGWQAAHRSLAREAKLPQRPACGECVSWLQVGNAEPHGKRTGKGKKKGVNKKAFVG